MIHTTSSIDTKDVLIGALNMGLERASLLKESILVSIVQPFSNDLSPLDLFAAQSQSESYRTFWGRPDQDFWMVGRGSAVELTSEGTASMDDVKDKYCALLENAIIEAPDIRGVGPVFMGGFRYDVQVARDNTWRSFPDALMNLPRFLFTWSNEGCWLTLNTLVTAETDAVTLAENLINEMKTLEKRMSYVVHQPEIKQVIQSPQEEWSKRVNDSLQSIQDGLLSKIVLARRKVLLAGGQFSLEQALEQLSGAYPACTVFAIDKGESSFVGATPESLASVEKGLLNFHCLAGSSPRGSDPEEDQRLQEQLTCSQKERQEHAAVVQMLISRLKKTCFDLQWNEVPEVLKLRNIQHLLTSFNSTLYPGSGVLDTVRQLHPTPAVAGVPTDRALESIRKLEGDRGWYAAPVGWMNHAGEGEFVIAIRSALLRDHRAVLCAGAGIVEGSDPDREFQETELKFQPMLSALGGV